MTPWYHLNFAGRARALIAPLTEGKPSLPNLRFSRAAPGRAFGAASWELTPAAPSLRLCTARTVPVIAFVRSGQARKM